MNTFREHKDSIIAGVLVGLFIVVVATGCAHRPFVPEQDLREGMTKDSLIAVLEQDNFVYSDMRCTYGSEGYETCQIQAPQPNGQGGPPMTIAFATFDREGRLTSYQAERRR